ncbi:MAG: LON peptidase substrate-binding domain-containing protein [Planctomycetaceae bacterium]
MADEPLAFESGQFQGLARVFPLPGLVMFPHVMQALHIFEPRYKALLEDALASDRLITMATYAQVPGEVDPTRPPLEPIACLCRVATHQRTAEGTYNVLLLGVRRLRLGNEMPAVRPFRVFEAEILEDEEPDYPEEASATLQHDLLAAFRRTLPDIPQAQEQLDQLLGSDVSLGMLADIVAYSIDLEPRWKLLLLAEPSVVRRTRLLVEALVARSRRQPRPFPPPFSRN